MPNAFKAFLARKLEAGGAESTIYLDSITTLTGETISTSDFSLFGRGIITIQPDGDGEQNFPEWDSFTGIDTGDTALTGVIRGLSAKGDGVVTDNIRFYPAGTPVVIAFGYHAFADLISYIDDIIAAIVIGSANVVAGLCGENVVAGNGVYLKNDGKWWKWDADISTTLDGMQLGIAQGAGTANGAITGGVLRKGLDTHQSGLVAGTEYLVSNTAGAISSSAGTYPRKIGVARSATNLYFDPDYGVLPTSSGKQFLDAMTGSIVTGAWSATPAGFLLCDGTSYLRATYPDLFASIGTTWGAADGTHFNVPDLRDRFMMGKGAGVWTTTFAAATDVNTGTDIITVPTNTSLYSGTPVVLTTSGVLPTGLSLATTYYVIRLSNTTIQLASSLANAIATTPVAIDITGIGSGTNTITVTLTTRTLGEKGGEDSRSLSVLEMPSHNHPQQAGTGSLVGAAVATTVNKFPIGNDGNFTDIRGGSTPHNIVSPFAVVTIVIKT